ncbi:membrane-associated guanylate kinase, WW and PDZ domain-containing protein 1-like isoform X3 [Trichogramma pretiosum]|uniref:membrane-associated guanylate kinase, WW and PDZ domain-containing protein 1-like isoform X3 n=1 Tax=Trichogramma pretiosum TaxID=7493 RepID=UPI0006C9BC1F|nr:membrane-associated guanylate kinase, WW and PDZ domain-containing protein 1-like isoform X3 [Trichogramma pretiosum]
MMSSISNGRVYDNASSMMIATNNSSPVKSTGSMSMMSPVADSSTSSSAAAATSSSIDDPNNDADSMSKEILATLDQQSDSSNSFYNHHNNHYNHQDQMQQQLSSSMNSSQQQQNQQQQQQQMQQMQQQQQQQSQQQQQRVPPTYVYSTEHHHHSHLYHNERNDNLDDVEVDVDDENNHHDLYHQHNNRHNNHNHHNHNHDGEPPSSQQHQQQQQHNNYRNQLAEDQLGPLPLNWEKAFTETGEVYFIDHNTGTSHWLDPRLSKFQKRSLEECLDDELPYGWEKIEDTLYGTYFIDHVNRRTQYENPVIQAKRAQQMLTSMNEHNNKAPPPSGGFTRNPDALKGQRLRTTLVKSSRGLGFTIIGGDDNCQEFLQIKSVAANGPAWLDGKLQTGDVLVYVNDICVLGFTHNEMVQVFKSIASGETVSLEVCRGYPLPFDPNDPNTEVLTTIAVNPPEQEQSLYMDLERAVARGERFDFLNSATSFMPVSHRNGVVVENLASNASVTSMPDLCISEKFNIVKRPNSTDLLLNDSVDHAVTTHHRELHATEQQQQSAHSPISGPKSSEFLTIPIVKGITGFGFTIADSAHGQKVKKILDRERCKNLMESDILVSINDVNVRNMCHAEVVQVLKDCHRDQEALIYVQRSAALKSPLTVMADKESNGSPSKDKHATFDFFRSKTPTADIYSTQAKTVVPQRSKTPLIDTRYNKETACSPLPPLLPSSSNVIVPPQQTVAELRDALENRYNKFNNSNGNYANQPIYGYTDVPYKTEMSHMTDSFAGMGLNTRLDVEDSLREVLKQREDWLGMSMNGGENIYGISVNHHSQSPMSNHHMPKQNGGTYHHQAQQEPMGDYYKDIYGTTSHYDNGQHHHQDYMAMCAGQEQNVDTGEIWDKRKESTSFEHEQPRSSSITQQYANYGDGMMRVSDMVYSRMPDIEWIESLVTLIRHDNGFGFRIVGGTEEGAQQVSVGHIVPGGAADQDGRLSSGDLIVSVDGESVLNSSHHRVVQLMIAAAQNGQVTLGVRRRVMPQEHQLHREQMQSVASNYGCRGIGLTGINHIQYPYDVTVTREENEGFGFVLISSVNKAGSTIGRIIESSPAERCGRLNVGDHILAVNRVDITNACHKDIVNLIKDSGYSVTLTIGYPLDDCCSNTSLSQKDETISEGDSGQYHAVELTRGTRGFGFSIRGGREFQNMPLFVLQIAENGPASIDNRLRVGDQIIEINGINTKNMTHTEAIEIIRNGGPTVRLLVRRGCQMPSVNYMSIDELNEAAEDSRMIEHEAANSQIITRRSKDNKRVSLSCCCTTRPRRLS